MNEEQKTKIQEAQDHLDEAKVLIEGVKDELQGEFDAMPDDKQEADAGEALEELIDRLDEAAISCLALDTDLGKAKED